MIAAIYARKSPEQIGRTTRENMMGKRTSSAKRLNKEPNGNGSSVDQQILATLQEILSHRVPPARLHGHHGAAARRRPAGATPAPASEGPDAMKGRNDLSEEKPT